MMLKKSPSEVLKQFKNIAVYGCTNDPAKPSHYVPAYTQSRGYRIIPIHPREQIILGEKVYPSILEVPDRIDILNVFRRSDKIPELLPEILERRNKRGDLDVLWLQLGITSEEARQAAEAAGIIFIQDTCMLVELRKLS